MPVIIKDLALEVTLLNANAHIRENRTTGKTSTFVLKISSKSTGFETEAFGVSLSHVDRLFDRDRKSGWVIDNGKSSLSMARRGESVVFRLECDVDKTWSHSVKLDVEAPVSCFETAQEAFFELRKTLPATN